MRVAWVHPTWRELVIERLAGDAALRRRFLGRCGPHGIVLALSTLGGAEGERQLPLIGGDKDWDAIGDRIYALAPELEPQEAVAVLAAVENLLEAVLGDPMLAGEAVALGRTVLERFGDLWSSAHTSIALSCIDAWLSVAGRLAPPPQPTFLSVTWAELLPTELPDPGDLVEVQRFTDWVTLCELLGEFSRELLEQLGFSDAHNALIHRYRELPHPDSALLAGSDPPIDVHAPWDDVRQRVVADSTVRRVLADL